MKRYAVTFTDGKHGDEGIMVECDANNKEDARYVAYTQLLADLEEIQEEHHIKVNLDTLRVQQVIPLFSLT